MARTTHVHENAESMVGRISFIVGLALAAIIAIFSSASVPMWSVFVIALVGVIVGLLNITDYEVQGFLVASIAFLLSFQALSSVASALTFGWSAVATFFGLMNVFIAPAAAIVAIKALFTMTRN